MAFDLSIGTGRRGATPNGLEMSRPASSWKLSQARFFAAGRVGSIELLGDCGIGDRQAGKGQHPPSPGTNEGSNRSEPPLARRQGGLPCGSSKAGVRMKGPPPIVGPQRKPTLVEGERAGEGCLEEDLGDVKAPAPAW